MKKNANITILSIFFLVLGCAPCMTYLAQSAVTDEGLLLYWSFDERDEIVQDLSGHQRHGTIEGATWVPDGVVGGAMYLAGPHQRIHTSDEGFPTGDAPRTFSWWVAVDDLRPSYHTDFMYYGSIEFNHASIVGVDWRHGRDCPAFSQWGAVYLSNRRIDQALTWYHLTFVYGGQGDYTYYINGEKWAGYSEMRRPLQTELGGAFVIGCHGKRSCNSLGGFIDEVRIYERALHEDVVRELFDAGRDQAEKKVMPQSIEIAQASAGNVSINSPHKNHVATQSDIPVYTKESVVLADSQAIEGNENFEALSSPVVMKIGFSNKEGGDQDTTVFHVGESLIISLEDVDIDHEQENIVYRATVSQKSSLDQKIVSKRTIFETDENNIAWGTIILDVFVPGHVQIDLVGMDIETHRIIFMRSSWLTLVESMN
jgi:hypothetical protein